MPGKQKPPPEINLEDDDMHEEKFAVNWPPADYYPALIGGSQDGWTSFELPDFPEIADGRARDGSVMEVMTAVISDAVLRRKAEGKVLPFASEPETLMLDSGKAVVMVPYIPGITKGDVADG